MYIHTHTHTYSYSSILFHVKQQDIVVVVNKTFFSPFGTLSNSGCGFAILQSFFKGSCEPAVSQLVPYSFM